MKKKIVCASTPVVYFAAIGASPDSESAIGSRQVRRPRSYALYLSLPSDAVQALKENELALATNSVVFQMDEDFLVALIILQAQSTQVRVVVPICDKKARAWLVGCMTKSRIECFMSVEGAHGYGRVGADKLRFPELGLTLAIVRRPHGASAFEILLAIASSLPGISSPESLSTYISGVAVDRVHICVVRDFFNTQACAKAAREMLCQRPDLTAWAEL